MNKGIGTFFRKFSIITLLLVTVGFGCKGLSQEEQASIAPIRLTYWTVFEDVTQLRNFAVQYQAQRPYVTIDIRQVRIDEFDKIFVNALADDVGPDIVSIHTRWLGRYQNKLAPMPKSVTVSNVYVKGKYNTDLVVEPVSFEMPNKRGIESAFVGTVADDVISGNSTYGLPLSLDTMALYYNKDLLDKAGIPEPPRTWDAFLEAVKKATKFDRDGRLLQSGVALGTGTNIDNSEDILALLMMQNGVDVTKGKSVTFHGGLARNPQPNHPALEALRFYTDFARPTKEAYSWNESQENALDAFTRGKTVFYFGFAFDHPRIRARAPQMNIEIVPVPQLNPAEPVNVANYWMQSVTKKTKAQDEAWDFIRFMTLPENIASYTKATRRPTPLRSQIQAQSEDLVLGAFADTVLNAKNWYRGRDDGSAIDAMNTLITNYLKPYGPREVPTTRDVGLIINAANVMQQTM